MAANQATDRLKLREVVCLGAVHALRRRKPPGTLELVAAEILVFSTGAAAADCGKKGQLL
jgi:hypothetical protein